ncbi:MAG: flagellar assembly protein FliW [Bacteroidota bacterium]|nr:flagellar assembly protein FliW [Candidatus Kapabacteria bacterium]MCX7937033.1 flagellar assembly protein FliW [Chlorobiota bacterium]MDW8075504.1 flagellar assembly protein FliW [Bacteroidota bacterium]MDW8272361.1 flagellar assembly protein FliW [Bacteroidota bacterium]
METMTTLSTPVTAGTPQKSIHKLSTEQFGDILIEERHIFLFPNGLLGFEELRRFVIVRDERTEPVRWLLSVEHPELSFPVLSPYFLVPDYTPGKDYSDLQRYTPLVILTLGTGGATANLKAPVILDVHTQQGEQIIIPSDKYSTAHPLSVQQTEK